MALLTTKATHGEGLYYFFSYVSTVLYMTSLFYVLYFDKNTPCLTEIDLLFIIYYLLLFIDLLIYLA